MAAAFFGLKAAVLAIVLQALVRVGKRALKAPVMRGIAAASFVAIFFFALPFPLIILAAGAIGFAGGWRGAPAFAAGGGHGPLTADGGQPSLLGEELPEHARPSLSRAAWVATLWLVLWLTPIVGLVVLAGDASVFTSIAIFFSKLAVTPRATPPTERPTAGIKSESLAASSRNWVAASSESALTPTRSTRRVSTRPRRRSSWA